MHVMTHVLAERGLQSTLRKVGVIELQEELLVAFQYLKGPVRKRETDLLVEPVVAGQWMTDSN